MFTEPLIVQKMNTQLGYLTERQAILSQNIANVDTPDYRAQDLKKMSFDDMVSSSSTHLPMATTSGKHLSSLSTNNGNFDPIFERKPVEKKPFGNNVVLEEQLEKVSDVGAQHQLTSTLLHKYNTLYRTAVDSHGS